MANWTEEEKKKIWVKGTVCPPNSPDEWRKDQCGAWMNWYQYGNRQNEYGWEIDHVKPDSKGGPDIVSNARPLQWKNNSSRQSGRLTCPVKANGIHNEDDSN